MVEPLTNGVGIRDGDESHEVLNQLIPSKREVVAVVVAVLDVTKRCNTDPRVGVQNGAQDEFVIIGNWKMRIVPADLVVECGVPTPNVIGHTDDVAHTETVDGRADAHVLESVLVERRVVRSVPQSKVVAIRESVERVFKGLDAVRVDEGGGGMLSCGVHNPFEELGVEIVVMIQFDEPVAVRQPRRLFLERTDVARVAEAFVDTDAEVGCLHPFQRGSLFFPRLALLIGVVEDDPFPIGVGLAKETGVGT